MQNFLVLMKSIIPENLGFALIWKRFRALSLKNEQVSSEVEFKINSDINSRYFKRVNCLGEDFFILLHSFWNIFLKKEK